jgi:hypothetical protein
LSRPAGGWGLWANRQSPIAAALLLVSGVALALVSGVETQRLVLLLFQISELQWPIMPMAFTFRLFDGLCFVLHGMDGPLPAPAPCA